MQIRISRGMGQVSTALLAQPILPTDNTDTSGSGFTLQQQQLLCTQAGADTVWDPTTNSCLPTTPGPAPSACSSDSNPCGFSDYAFWPSSACTAWYAQCDPTSPFYIATTKGALAALGTTAGNAVGATAGGLFSGLAATMGVPVWVIYAALGFVAYKMVTK